MDIKYNAIVFLPSGRQLKYHTSEYKSTSFKSFLNKEFPDWKYYNLYYFYSRDYAKRIYNPNNANQD